jgi:hypothetical protein
MKTMIVVDHLHFSEKNYDMINEVNSVVSNSVNEVSVVSMNLSDKVIDTKFAIMNPVEIDGFDDGVLVALDLKYAREILSSMTNSTKVLYLWDIEWFYRVMNYRDIFSILCNKELTIITRSKNHNQIIKRITGKDTSILPHFNLEKIWNSLKETKTK